MPKLIKIQIYKLVITFRPLTFLEYLSEAISMFTLKMWKTQAENKVNHF